METITEKVANIGDNYLSEIFGDFKTAQHYLNKYTFETIVIQDYNKGFPDSQRTRIDTTSSVDSGVSERFIEDGTSRMMSDERSLGQGDNYNSAEAAEWKESHNSILEPTRTGMEELAESSLSANHSTPLVAQVQPQAEFPESSSLNPSTPLVVHDRPKTDYDLHMSSPDIANTPSTVSDNHEISCTTVCLPKPKNVIAGMSTSIKGQTEQNMTPKGDSSLDQSPEAKSLRRSKRKASHPIHNFDKDWSWKVPTKKLSKKINRSVQDLQGKFQVMPERDERNEGKLERGVAGDSEEPIVSRNERQTLEGQRPTSGDEILATQAQMANIKRKRTKKERRRVIKDKIVASGDLEPLKHKLTKAESEGTNHLEMREGIIRESKRTAEQEAMRLATEGDKQTISGDYEKMTENTEVKSGYDTPMLTSYSPRDCGTDQCIDYEDQIQATEIRTELRDHTEEKFDFHHRGEKEQLELPSGTDQYIGRDDQIQATEIRTELRDHTEERFDFPHRGENEQMDFPNKEATNTEASRESGFYNLPRPYHIQRYKCDEERKQNREQNNGTSRHRPYLQQYNEIGDDGYNHNQSDPQITESGCTVLETREYRCNNTLDTLHNQRNYNSSYEKQSYGDHNQTYIKYDSSDKAGNCCRCRHSSPREERKRFNVFDKKIPAHETTLEKSYRSNVDLQQFRSGRKHRRSTANRLRTLELEQENSRLRKEVSYLKARLGVISKAVLKASETILCEAFAEVSEEDEEEEEEEELASDTAVGESDEEYSFSRNEGDNDQLFRLYESFIQRGDRRRSTIRRQTFKSIKGEARQRTPSTIAKRYIRPKYLASSLKRKRFPQNLKNLD